MESADLAELNAILDRQIAGLKAVQLALKAERSALEARDTSSLEQVTAQKQLGLQSVEKADSQRRSLMAAAGYETLDQTEGHPALLERMSRLEQLARECQQQNQINGALINMQQKLVTRTLHVLRQGEPGGPVTYGSDGGDTQPRSRIPIGTA